MPDRIIKPDSGNQLVLQDAGGTARMEIADGGTTLLKDEGGASALIIGTDGDIYSTAWTTFTPTTGGSDFDGSPTINSAVWMRLGSNVFFKIDITGTSTANTFTIASLPHAAAAGVWGVWIPYGENNSDVAGSKMNGYIVGGTSTIVMCLESNDSGWTDTNTKRAVVQSVYRAASW